MNYRRRAEQLVEVYVESMEQGWIYGWHQSRAGSQISRMIEFSGDIPPPRGIDQPDLAMISEITRMRRTNALLYQADKLLARLTDKQRTVLIATACYVGTSVDGEIFTASLLAEKLGLTNGQYRQLLLRSRRALERNVKQEYLQRPDTQGLQKAA